MVQNRWKMLALLVGLCLGVGSIAGFAVSASVVDWYPTLTKPSWTPPVWLFGPAWTVLYIMMAVAAWLVWQRQPASGRAMTLFYVQLILNFGWSFFFFGLRSPLLGLFDIIALWTMILLTAFAFFRHSHVAGAMMVPYLLWVSFATALNIAIVLLN
jgi:translocator protein